MRRPRSITLVGVLLVLYGLALMLTAGLVTLLALWPEALQLSQAQALSVLDQISRLDVVLLGGQVLIGLIMLTSGIGLLQLRGWAWLMAIIGLGVHLLILLIDYWRHDPMYWAMLISAMLCFLLNLREVKQTLGLIEDPNDNTRLHDTWEEPADAREHRSLLRRRG
ncbi:MAG TPA: hypothetical protein PLO33_17930 [Kouleothrix sp.]|uniref:hypothetical protein n=1 Tax=Kouleothrix sp. TaxID=2779161 RepID=UPI002B78EFBE|nr:hypothetical protein [Kouleothrix sp.]HRC77568.1 hypothetical protein [Kouleothrix sp.]